ncbi:membrane protein insertase YidC [Bacillus sp. DTU_2020_1000418_1_SI_GHA_SEK_038]|uniref:membrane protein insertase YidC n=1 Tax=Bacillus sp. DTU_2020_1000418_1_SI_GHA_SEK_038 TaxID=3077585 RepID=UPI0028EBCE18|nr:membrane protein insertase YidC [Bacillus sp. DTU_2020_1000418_1_SI_GHA_SEK_038]WNS73514.1 membrane protein insertase YidC [Bacillus sp. DTU_2020_1000418_1_SI_GHA_SEK_038]
MKNKKSIFLFILISVVTLFLSACSTQIGQNNDGIFHKIFVEPFASLIHGTAAVFNDNYGISIIIITLGIRLILMPLMLKQYKNQRLMKEKMDALKPEMDEIQKKLKAANDPKEKQMLQKELMGLYQKHGVNPLNMGCLPILIQMPILMGFYYAISGSEEIAAHSFLWFNLGHADIWITAAAGIVYFFQFKVSQVTMPIQQQQQMKFMGLLSPIMIVMVSLNAPAALPLYWTVGGIFLTIQTMIGKKLYPSEKKDVLQTSNPISGK